MKQSGTRTGPAKGAERNDRRRSYGFWLLAALGVIDVILVRAHLLTVGQAVLASLVVKLVLGGNILAGANAYRRSRARGRTVAAALSDGLGWILPRWTALLTVLMLKVCLDLLLAPLRRKRRGPNVHTIHHDPTVIMLWWFNIVVTIVTLVVIEIGLTLADTSTMWHLLDVAANAFQLWVLLGLWAGAAAKGHRLDPDGLMLRGVVFGEISIPYSSIATVRTVSATTPGIGSWGRFVIDPSTAKIILAVGPMINVVVTLRRPMTFDPYRHGTPRGPVETILLCVDDPDRFSAGLRDHLSQGEPRGGLVQDVGHRANRHTTI